MTQKHTATSSCLRKILMGILVILASTVVGQKQDQGILEGAHRLQLVHHPANVAIHSVDHRRVDGHFDGLELLLLRRKFAPGQRPVDLARSQLLERVREVIGWADFLFEGWKRMMDQAKLSLAPPAFSPDHVPAYPVAVGVAGNVRGGSVQREMRRGETEVMKKRVVGMVPRVFL